MFKKQTLSAGSTMNLGRIVRSFTNVMEQNNDVYAFYRGKIFSGEMGVICFEFLVSDIDGRLKLVQMAYMSNEDKLMFSRDFSVNNKKAVIKAVIAFVGKLEMFNPPLSVVRFDFAPSYKKAVIEPSRADEGCADVTLVGKVYAITSYGLSASGRIRGDLVQGWEA